MFRRKLRDCSFIKKVPNASLFVSILLQLLASFLIYIIKFLESHNSFLFRTKASFATDVFFYTMQQMEYLQRVHKIFIINCSDRASLT